MKVLIRKIIDAILGLKENTAEVDAFREIKF